MGATHVVSTRLTCHHYHPAAAALALGLAASAPLSAAAQQQASPVGAAAGARVLSQQLHAPEAPGPGDPLTLTLEIEHPVSARVELPGEDSVPNPRWELLDRRETTRVDQEDRAITTVKLVFGVYRPGATTLPPLSLEVRAHGGAAGEPQTLQTEPVRLTVVSQLDPARDGDAPALARAQPPRSLVVEDWTLVYALAGGGALLFLIPALVWAWRRRPQPQAPPPVPVAEDDEALRKLAALAAGDLLERGELEAFYVEMSATLREYFGRRYRFPEAELTRREILERLRPVHLRPGISLDDIGEWLAHTDRVKFGGLRPATAEAEAALRRAFTIVELTRRLGTRAGEMPSADVDAPAPSLADTPPAAEAAAAPAPSLADAPPAAEAAAPSSPLAVALAAQRAHDGEAHGQPETNRAAPRPALPVLEVPAAADEEEER